jgi:phosphoribosylaminoimidazole carboxylase (NCAIR synthetase)
MSFSQQHGGPSVDKTLASCHLGNHQDQWVILLGGNELNQGFGELARAWNCKLLVVDWNEQPAVKGDLHLKLDIKDADAVVDALRGVIPNIRLAYTSADVATETVAKLHELSGHLRPLRESLFAARNKAAMNEAWERADVLGKKFKPCSNSRELEQFAKSVAGSSIVKPVDSASSRGITLIRSNAVAGIDFQQVFDHAAKASSTPVVLIEEYIPGTEFTVEMIGDSYGNVEVWGISKKYHTQNTQNNCISVKLHYAAQDVARSVLEDIADFGMQCFRALGLTTSLGHLEIIRSEDGKLTPVELAARSSGYIATHLLDALTDVPYGFLKRYTEVLRGGKVQNGLRPSVFSSMYFFYDPPPGIWSRNDVNLLSFCTFGIQSLAYNRAQLREGLRTGFIDSDTERIGFEILSGSPENLTIDNISEAERALYATCLAQPLERTIEKHSN